MKIKERPNLIFILHALHRGHVGLNLYSICLKTLHFYLLQIYTNSQHSDVIRNDCSTSLNISLLTIFGSNEHIVQTKSTD